MHQPTEGAAAFHGSQVCNFPAPQNRPVRAGPLFQAALQAANFAARQPLSHPGGVRWRTAARCAVTFPQPFIKGGWNLGLASLAPQPPLLLDRQELFWDM